MSVVLYGIDKLSNHLGGGMVRDKIYPNYTDLYYYTSGEKYIVLKRRSRDGKERLVTIIELDTVEEAEEYFEGVWK